MKFYVEMQQPYCLLQDCRVLRISVAKHLPMALLNHKQDEGDEPDDGKGRE